MVVNHLVDREDRRQRNGRRNDQRERNAANAPRWHRMGQAARLGGLNMAFGLSAGVIGGLAAGAGALGGAYLSSRSANNAANSQYQANQAALDEQRREFDINQGNQQPYLDAGRTALGQYQTDIGRPVTAADV